MRPLGLRNTNHAWQRIYSLSAASKRTGRPVSKGSGMLEGGAEDWGESGDVVGGAEPDLLPHPLRLERSVSPAASGAWGTSEDRTSSPAAACCGAGWVFSGPAVLKIIVI